MSKLRLFPPIYLLFSREKCYRCGAGAPVVAIACKKFAEVGGANEVEEDDEEPILISDMVAMPAALLQAIHALHPYYEKRHSRMAGFEYFMNICPHCKAHFGDFFLFSEPDGAFFPMEEAAFAAIKIRKLPIDNAIEVDAGYSMGLGAEIFAKGQII